MGFRSVNAEYAHQLFGGEISDHFKIQGKLTPEAGNSFLNNDQKLGDLYNSQVKPVGQVAVTHSPTNVSMDALIERQPDPLVQQLQDTLSRVAREHGLQSDTQTNINFTPSLRDQSDADLQQANDAVARALEELKSLGEI
jgi:uncharacterized protein (DUF2267 family)